MNSPSQPDSWIGRLIGERQRYRLENRLGAGGMGDVFLAMDTLLGQRVALKLLKDTLVKSESLRKRFEREVALCAALKSDHIVDVSDYGITEEGHPFYVMEYLRGQSLRQLLQQQQRLSVERTVSIIAQICQGLHLAHEGVTLWRDGATATEHVLVVHRDLKPDNIFLVPTALGELVKILDFGIAKIRHDTAETTSTTMFLGTFRYAAPEQWEAENSLDRRADIYSLGIILYEMLSGSDPFGFGIRASTTSGVSWAIAHATKPIVPLRSQPGLEQLSPELEAVVIRCLQKIPNERFTSVSQLKQSLLSAAAVESKANDTASPQPPTVFSEQGDDKTIFRPLIPPEQGSTAARIDQNPPLSGQSDNSSINRPPTFSQQEVSEPLLALQQSSLLEILMELVGPIAPTLLRQVSAQASSRKELVEKLALYLSPKQRIEFEKKTVPLLSESPAQSQAKLSNSPSWEIPSINASFVKQCEQDLVDLIGPVATLLVQRAVSSHPQISPSDLVKLLAAEIPDPRKAKKFSQRLLDLST